MAILKQIKFGTGASTPIAKTIVNGKGVIAVTNTGGRKNDLTEQEDYSYDIDVNVDGSTIVKDGSQLAVGTVPAEKVSVAASAGLTATEAQAAFQELKTAIDKVEDAAKSYEIVQTEVSGDENVKEQYQLQETVGETRTLVGVPIKIYKDSSLKEVYLGTNEDTVDAASGTVTKKPATDPQSMNFVYHLADGTYSITKIDVSKFLSESEFKDGLDVTDHVVKVKVDASSEGFLTVGENGVKLSGVQDTINAAKAAATTKVVEGTDDGNNLEIASAKESDGSTTYTINLTDVASKTALDAEIAARKAVDGQEGQTYAANASTNYIKQASSLNDADVKLDAALKAEADRAKAAEEAEVTRAQNAEGEIAAKVGLEGVEGSRTFTPTTNYGAGTTTVKGNMQAIDTKLKEVEGKVADIQYHVDGTTLEFFGMTDRAGAGA